MKTKLMMQAAQAAVKGLFYILSHSQDALLVKQCKETIDMLCEKFSIHREESKTKLSSN
jgi:hypothetical protein